MLTLPVSQLGQKPLSICFPPCFDSNSSDIILNLALNLLGPHQFAVCSPLGPSRFPGFQGCFSLTLLSLLLLQACFLHWNTLSTCAAFLVTSCATVSGHSCWALVLILSGPQCNCQDALCGLSHILTHLAPLGFS